MKQVPIAYIIKDASDDIHATATTRQLAEEWIIKNLPKYHGRIHFTIHEVEVIG